MNLQQALLAIGNAQGNELPIEGLVVVKENWPEFYPELERIIDQFIAEVTPLTDEQQTILFFGTLLLAELKYSLALEKCLLLFSRSDTCLTPLEGVFGDALTELTPTLFYNVVDGNSQALCNYIVGGHQAMYCKASAIEAVFAQYEAGIIDEHVLSAHVTRWITVFSALPSSTNSFLMSALADSCINYKLDGFKPQFIELCDKNLGDKGADDKVLGSNSLFDEDRFKACEVKAWDSANSYKLIESGAIQTDFNVVDTLNAWIEDDLEEKSEGGSEEKSEDEALDSFSNEDLEDFDGFSSLMGEGGLLANMLYDEKTILENSVPVSSLPTVGRNDTCPCGSGKKYKKCCLR